MVVNAASSSSEKKLNGGESIVPTYSTVKGSSETYDSHAASSRSLSALCSTSR
jgi:hypothetical protein